jgi:AcrR family transcriptional regulator
MKTRLQQSNHPTCADELTGCALPARERVLEAACELFAESGFHGTHIRDICARAESNVAGVCYHFQGKERLYQAVMMEAGRRLSDADESVLAASRNLSPEQRLLKLTESLLEKLSAKNAWTAKLLARELVDTACAGHYYAGSGLERDFILLQAVMRDLPGTQANSDAVRLHALSLVGECVLYSLAAENPRHPLAQSAARSPTRPCLARFLTRRVLAALRLETVEAEDFNPCEAIDEYQRKRHP